MVKEIEPLDFLQKESDSEMEQDEDDKEPEKNPIVKEQNKVGGKRVRWKDEIEEEEEEKESEEDDDVESNNEQWEEENEEEDEDEFIEDDEEDDDNSSKFIEDIYGRKRDKKGNIVVTHSESKKYVPPAKRNESSTSERLRKELKGLLNRLSEANMIKIANQIEELYEHNSRNDMNETLVELIMSAVVQESLTPDRLIQEHAMLVALLHAHVGSEVGAHFLQKLAVKFDELYKCKSTEGKELQNVLLLLSCLYDFQVVHSQLMFEIFKRLSESFTSMDIELIILLLKNIGFTLRKDDPLALKELILTLQSKAREFSTEGEVESRIRFMLETLTIIRNNNLHKIPNYDPSHLEKLRKLLRNFVRKGCSVQELRISFEDLLNAETRGRWWIVGSSWSGNPLQNEEKTNEKTRVESDEFNEKVLALAKKQRMNTEIRRKIFCIIVTADDFLDCFEKLMRLDLQKQQGREIVHVLLHCCMNEATFNPYYAHLAGKFCEYDRKFQLAFQFALWDHFKELEKLKTNQLSNLAKWLAIIIRFGGLALSVLKAIHFSEINKEMKQFLRQLIVDILLPDSADDFQTPFLRIVAPKLRMLREGIRVFMHHIILKHKKFDETTLDQLRERINEVEKLFSEADAKNRL